MAAPVSGIHHVSAICAAPQSNIDFYVATLGLGLVKRTVNFDDPHTYHFYYGDDTGTPGSLLTFFPQVGARRGSIGAGMLGATAFVAAPGSIEYWLDRLAHLAHEYLTPAERFGERVLPLHDPEGLSLEIVERADAEAYPGWSRAPVEKSFRLRALAGVTLLVEQPEATAAILTDVLGYQEAGQDRGRLRFRAAAAGPGNVVDIVRVEGQGRDGAGTAHHVAFRVRDDAHQAELRDALLAAGMNVSDVRDRQYFRSIYFREPGGVLFELATDGPGMTVDEDPHRLGKRLRLPYWLEARRPEIERRLPNVAVPD